MNLAAALLQHAPSTPDRVALLSPAPTTYGELADRSGRLAARFTTGTGAPAIDPGDRVAIVAGNEPEFVVSYLAILTAGAVAVPLNGTSPSLELAREIEAVEPKLVVASRRYGDLARRATAQSETAVPVLVLDDVATSPDLVEPVEPVSRAAADVAVLLFTAGTAGPPRPAMLTHGSLLANLEQMQAHPGLRVEPGDVALAVLPLFHVFGLNVVLDLALFAGASVSLVDHFHPAETLARTRDDGVTILAAVPAIYASWLALDDADAPRDALPRVRLCVSGAARLDPDVASRFRARFGVEIHDGYGLTEASPAVTTSAVSASPRPGSVGPPLPGVELRLVDAEGHDVLEGDPGEILVRGANLFAGYWRDAGATDAVLDSDGWLHTGDVGVADADGWLSLVERVKDVVIVSGFNVFPGEVEQVLRTHPDVADVAVVGEPHPRTGETVVAFVVAKAGHRPEPLELLRHAGRRLARYKLPTRVELVDALPRSFAGKLLRRELSAPAGDADRAPDATANPA